MYSRVFNVAINRAEVLGGGTMKKTKLLKYKNEKRIGVVYVTNYSVGRILRESTGILPTPFLKCT